MAFRKKLNLMAVKLELGNEPTEVAAHATARADTYSRGGGTRNGDGGTRNGDGGTRNGGSGLRQQG